MKIFFIFLFVGVFIQPIFTMRNLQLLGAYRPLANYQIDSSFQAVDAFVKQQKPEILNGATVVGVWTQVVSGTNFKIDYDTADGVYQAIVFYQAFSNTMSLTSFNKISENPIKTPQIPTNPITGGYQDLINFQNDRAFGAVDGFVRTKQPIILDGATVISVQTQVVNGLNYKIRYSTSNGIYEAIVYKSLDIPYTLSITSFTKVDSPNPPTQQPKPILAGGYQLLTNWRSDSTIKNINNFVLRNKYGILKCPKIIRVATQIVSGINYKIHYYSKPQCYEAIVFTQSWTNTISLSYFNQTSCSIFSKQQLDKSVDLNQIKHCQKYNRKHTKCILCDKGMILHDNKCLYGFQTKNEHCSVVINNKCQHCDIGYTLKKYGSCVKIQKNCETVDIQSGDCEHCNDGFSLKNGECIQNI